MTRRRGAAERGQATVELVALLPVLMAVGLGAGQVLAAGAARELAGHGAQAGAAAILQGKDPERAARDALPGWSHERIAVRVDGRRVVVRVRPVTIVPGVGRSMTATVAADAGPPP